MVRPEIRIIVPNNTTATPVGSPTMGSPWSPTKAQNQASWSPRPWSPSRSSHTNTEVSSFSHRSGASVIHLDRFLRVFLKFADNREAISKEDYVRCLLACKVHPTIAEGVFHLSDVDNNGILYFDEFSMSILALNGTVPDIQVPSIYSLLVSKCDSLGQSCPESLLTRSGYEAILQVLIPNVRVVDGCLAIWDRQVSQYCGMVLSSPVNLDTFNSIYCESIEFCELGYVIAKAMTLDFSTLPETPFPSSLSKSLTSMYNSIRGSFPNDRKRNLLPHHELSLRNIVCNGDFEEYVELLNQLKRNKHVVHLVSKIFFGDQNHFGKEDLFERMTLFAPHVRSDQIELLITTYGGPEKNELTVDQIKDFLLDVLTHKMELVGVTKFGKGASAADDSKKALSGNRDVGVFILIAGLSVGGWLGDTAVKALTSALQTEAGLSLMDIALLHQGYAISTATSHVLTPRMIRLFASVGSSNVLTVVLPFGSLLLAVGAYQKTPHVVIAGYFLQGLATGGLKTLQRLLTSDFLGDHPSLTFYMYACRNMTFIIGVGLVVLGASTEWTLPLWIVLGGSLGGFVCAFVLVFVKPKSSASRTGVSLNDLVRSVYPEDIFRYWSWRDVMQISARSWILIVFSMTEFFARTMFLVYSAAYVQEMTKTSAQKASIQTQLVSYSAAMVGVPLCGFINNRLGRPLLLLTAFQLLVLISYVFFTIKPDMLPSWGLSIVVGLAFAPVAPVLTNALAIGTPKPVIPLLYSTWAIFMQIGALSAPLVAALLHEASNSYSTTFYVVDGMSAVSVVLCGVAVLLDVRAKRKKEKTVDGNILATNHLLFFRS